MDYGISCVENVHLLICIVCFDENLSWLKCFAFLRAIRNLIHLFLFFFFFLKKKMKSMNLPNLANNFQLHHRNSLFNWICLDVFRNLFSFICLVRFSLWLHLYLNLKHILFMLIWQLVMYSTLANKRFYIVKCFKFLIDIFAVTTILPFAVSNARAFVFSCLCHFYHND